MMNRMKALLVVHGLLFSVVNYAQTPLKVDVNSRIDFAEFKYTGPRKSWCIFTDYDSSVQQNYREDQSSETSSEMNQVLSRRGREYKLREVSWNGTLENNRLTINFAAERPHLDARHNYENTTCRYKTWEGKLSHSKVEFNGSGTIVIPKQVWVLKVKVNEFNSSFDTNVRMTNLQYVDVPEKGEDLIEVPLKKFQISEGEYIFIVNPSTVEYENFINIYINHVNNSNRESDFNLDLEVQFLGQDSCVQNLKGKTVKDILGYNLSDLPKLVENQACLLNASHIKYILEKTPINQFSNLLTAIDEIEEQVLSTTAYNSYDQHLLSIYKEMMDRARFYYSYEIAKDFLRLLSPVETGIYSESGEEIKTNGLFYLQGLRLRNRYYLLNSLQAIEYILSEIEQGPEFFKPVARHQETYVHVLSNNIVNDAISSLKNAFQRFTPPKYLGMDYVSPVLSYVDELNEVYKVMNASLLEIKGDNVSSIKIRKSRQDIIEFRLVLQKYFNAWELFQQKMYENNTLDSTQIIEHHRLINAQLKTLIQTNLVMMKDVLNKVFYENFEDELFLNAPVNGKVYEHPEDLISDLKRLLDEI